MNPAQKWVCGTLVAASCVPTTEQSRTDEARAVEQQFEAALKNADLVLTSSAF